MKNKMIFFNKWLSTRPLDAHLAKSLPNEHIYSETRKTVNTGNIVPKKKLFRREWFALTS